MFKNMFRNTLEIKLKQEIENYKKLNNELSEWDDVVNKVNEIVGYINEQEPQPVTVLWVIRNKDTHELIFNARGGAYKDKEAALNEIKKLGS